jgi:hypothetical protein
MASSRVHSGNRELGLASWIHRRGRMVSRVAGSRSHGLERVVEAAARKSCSRMLGTLSLSPSSSPKGNCQNLHCSQDGEVDQVGGGCRSAE